MPLTYSVDSVNGVLRAKGDGMLSMDDLRAYFTATRADPLVEPTMHRLMDLRGVTQLPSTDELRQLATFSRANAPDPSARMALLASSDLAFGVSMMFKAYAGYGERLAVVRDEAEAMAWLLEG